MRWALRGCAVVSTGIVGLILVFLVVESLPAWSHVGVARLLTDDGWHPASAAVDGTFNLTPMLVGTLAATAGALLLAAPVGIASAVFCHFYAPRAVARWYRRLIELLAGIPSVVYGFWGLTTLAPWIRRIEPPGTSLVTGILVLALMIVPTIAILADASIRQVPRSYLRASAALALSPWSTAWRVVLPVARAGLGTAIILGTARAIGETMAVLMVCGNIVQVPDSLFAPVRTLTANIALELGYASGDHRAALFMCGLVLMALVVGLVAVADRLQREPRHA